MCYTSLRHTKPTNSNSTQNPRSNDTKFVNIDCLFSYKQPFLCICLFQHVWHTHKHVCTWSNVATSLFLLPPTITWLPTLPQEQCQQQWGQSSESQEVQGAGARGGSDDMVDPPPLRGGKRGVWWREGPHKGTPGTIDSDCALISFSPLFLPPFKH